MTFRAILGLTAVMMFTAFSATAEKLSGQQIASLLPGSERVFAAGSVARFAANGSYTFDHGNAVENGSYAVTTADQLVLSPSQGQQSVARIESTGNASFPYKMVYLRGPFRGKSFDFR